MAKLNIISYNPTGFSRDKAEFMKSLKADILCLQEHFLLRSNIFKLQNEFTDFNFCAVPATKQDKVISSGRPSGGLAILWPKSSKHKIQQLKLNNSNRVQAVSIDSTFLLLNCYFPCDTQNNNFNEWELLKCLEDIRYCILSHPNLKVILAGDVNTDFSRNTPFVNVVRDFMLEEKLVDVWWTYPVDFTFSSSTNNRTSFSTIDHFIINDYVARSISDAGTIHLGDNLSCHEPIFLSLNVNITVNSDVPSTTNSNANHVIYKPCWNKVTPTQLQMFKDNLQQNINSMIIPPGIVCNDVKCSNQSHKKDIDYFCNSIMHAIDSATSNNIPPAKIPNEKRTPGWSDMVKPYQDDANFYYAIWVSYGKPLNCPLHNTMKHYKNLYRYSIRRLKRQEESIRNDKLLEHCLKGNSKNIVKEFNQQNPNRQHAADIVDGYSSSDDISNNFASIYKDLYQKNDSSDLLNAQLDGINSNISAENFTEVDQLTPAVVYQAISSLHKSKNDNSYNFKSDAVIQGKDSLVKHLTLLMQAFLIHSHVPKDILISSLHPIIKDKLGDKCSSSNYRAIGTSSIILKLLDLIILILFGNSLTLAEQQYGFQKKSSTTLCSWTVKETINYFLNRDTPVFACFLDMTKAFDLVNYSKLFAKLKDKVSPIFLRLLCYIYLNQMCNVSWNNSQSCLFKVRNGVKQGAILSPTLFSIYIDELFNLLKLSGYGCVINQYFYGALSYADDLVLLCPSRDGLQKMINLTKSFFDNLDLIISLNILEPDKSKTKCVAFGLKVDPVPLWLGSDKIPWSDQYTHLGHIMFRDGTFTKDCLFKRRTFIGKYHSLCQKLKQKDPFVYMKLISIYMCDFYGSNLWNLFNASSNDLYIMWNQMIRFVFKLPFRSHRYLLEPISETSHLFTKLTNRFIKFYSALSNCNKPIVHNLKNIQQSDFRSDFGMNVLTMCRLNNVNNFMSVKPDNIRYFPIPDSEKWRIPILSEIIQILNKNLYVDLDEPEIEFLLDFVSCT